MNNHCCMIQSSQKNFISNECLGTWTSRDLLNSLFSIKFLNFFLIAQVFKGMNLFFSYQILIFFN